MDRTTTVEHLDALDTYVTGCTCGELFTLAGTRELADADCARHEATA